MLSLIGITMIILVVIFVVMAQSVIQDMPSWANRTYRTESQKDGQGHMGKANRFANPNGYIYIGDFAADFASDGSGDIVVPLASPHTTSVVTQVISLVNNDPTKTVHFSVLSMGTGTFSLRVRQGDDSILNDGNVLFQYVVAVVPV